MGATAFITQHLTEGGSRSLLNYVPAIVKGFTGQCDLSNKIFKKVDPEVSPLFSVMRRQFVYERLTLLEQFDEDVLPLVCTLGLLCRSLLGSCVELFWREDDKRNATVSAHIGLHLKAGGVVPGQLRSST